MIMFCPRCGNERMEGANFCMKCGFDFSAAAVPTAAPAQAPVPGGPPPVINGQPWVQYSGVVNPYPVPGYAQYNPTYRCRCEYCCYEFDYHTYDLGHRAWYPHGFVYCPRCNKPNRHQLEFEVINGAYVPVGAAQAPAAAAPASPAPAAPAPALATSDDEAAAAATTTIIST